MVYVRSIESILAFLDEKEDLLIEKGYNPSFFFK